MKNIEIIISISGTALGFLITALTFIAKFIKSAKAKKAAENLIKIGSAVIPYIEQAEKYANYSGTEKKEYVLTKANQFAINQGIAFDAVSVGNKIEELVRLTKQVNKRDKDKIVATQQNPHEQSLTATQFVPSQFVPNN